MFVDADVSSMNTSRRGSSLACILIHILRAAATSGRSCSAACRLFFKGEAQMAQKSEDRGLADDHAVLGQATFKFRQREVRLRRDPAYDPILVRLQGISLVCAKLLSTDVAGPTPTRPKPAHRTDAEPARLRDLFIGHSRFDALNHAASQILRVRLAHPCWPPVQWQA